eukprot:Opistho-2@47409
MGSGPSKESPEWINSQAAATNLTYLEVERLAVRFRQLDSNSKGFIDASVLQAPEFDESPFAEDILDFRKKEKIDFQAFLRLFAWWKHVDNGSKLRRIYDILVVDSHTKGKLKEGDIVDILEAVRPDDDEAETLANARAIVAAVDEKKQGYIDADQFVRFASTKLSQETLTSLLAFAIIPGDLRPASSLRDEESETDESDDDEEEDDDSEADAPQRQEIVQQLLKISLDTVGMAKYDEAFVAAKQALIAPTEAWDEFLAASDAFVTVLGLRDGQSGASSSPAQLVTLARKKGLLPMRASLQAESSWIVEEEHGGHAGTTVAHTSGVLAWELKRKDQLKPALVNTIVASKQCVNRLAGSLATVIVKSNAAVARLGEIDEKTASLTADVSRIASSIGIEAPKVEKTIESNRTAVVWAASTVKQLCGEAHEMLAALGKELANA